MNKNVITVEKSFCDIDSLACAVAYRELLETSGQPAVVFIPGQLNYSVGKMAEGKNFEIEKTCPADVENFIIVDVSNPEKFHSSVNLDLVTDVFDHHPGFEKFWTDKLGEKSHNEPIGACATLIWEEFIKAKKEISPESANLLSAAIISNTKNFKAPNTSPRDRMALEQLKPFISLSANWIEKYYGDCEKNILKDLEDTIKNDTKIEQIPNQNQTLVIGQLETAEPKEVLKKSGEIEKVLTSMGSQHWMLNLTSLSGKENYFFSKDPETQNFLQAWQEVSFDPDGIADLGDKMVIRKLIVKELGLRPWK